MKRYLFMWFSSVILLGPKHFHLAKLSHFTLNDRCLPAGHTFESFFTPEWFQCLQACAKNTRCYSYSFDKRNTSAENCFLHECGFVDECAALDTLIFSKECVFHQLLPVAKSLSQNGDCLGTDHNRPIPDAVLEIQSSDVCSSSQGRIRKRVFKANICGNNNILLDKCTMSKKGKRIHLESIKYVECDCPCKSCGVEEGSVLCPSSNSYKTIRNKCQGSEACRVKIINECEDDGIRRSLRIFYRCV